MALTYNAFGGNLIGLTNAAAATAYYAVIPGHLQGYARVSGFNWTSGNTANSFYGLRPLGRANIAANATTSDDEVTLATDPSPSGNNLAAGDQCVIGPCTDGTYRRVQVNTSGWNSTSLVATFTANLAANVNTSAKLYNFGVFGDTDPTTASAHPRFITTANASGTFTFGPAGLCGHAKGDPLLIYNPNATNATDLNWLEYAFTTE